MPIELAWRRPPRIAVVGQTFPASRTVQRVAALRGAGCEVTQIATSLPDVDYESRPSLAMRIRYRLRMPADHARANRALLDTVRQGIDVVWLDAADMIHPSTLKAAKAEHPGLKVITYSEDDMMNRRLLTRWLQWCIPYIDLWVTTKSFNLDATEVPSLGVRRMFFVNNSYDSAIHRPIAVSPADRTRLGAQVSFIGTYERPRADSILALARAGIGVRVWGNGWRHLAQTHPNLRIEGRPVYNDDFAKAVSASDINLCFLRHANRDKQTCRSMEIIGCGAFMVHERNDEITALFRESQEAVYFSSDQELIKVCETWIEMDADRAEIGARGLARIKELELDHKTNMIRALNALTGNNSGTST